jgi:hypothetical protein
MLEMSDRRKTGNSDTIIGDETGFSQRLAIPSRFFNLQFCEEFCWRKPNSISLDPSFFGANRQNPSLHNSRDPYTPRAIGSAPSAEPGQFFP